jgi:hypothetical protein
MHITRSGSSSVNHRRIYRKGICVKIWISIILSIMSIGKTTPKKQNFKIAVLESSRITASLQRTTQQKNWNQGIQISEEIHSCQIVLIPYNSSIPMKNTLLFSLSLYWLYKKKVYIWIFILIDNKLRFEVHIKAINKAGIRIRSFFAACHYNAVID